MIRIKPQFILALMLIFAMTVIFIGISGASYTKEDKEIERISVQDARQLVESGQALLVCSYNDSGCETNLLQGALMRSDFESRLAALSKDQQIIFYCG
jgi:hypothetical protein